jgi:hypothetical protein
VAPSCKETTTNPSWGMTTRCTTADAPSPDWSSSSTTAATPDSVAGAVPLGAADVDAELPGDVAAAGSSSSPPQPATKKAGTTTSDSDQRMGTSVVAVPSRRRGHTARAPRDGGHGLSEHESPHPGGAEALVENEVRTG